MEPEEQAIDALLDERRVFEPPADFRARAEVSDDSMHAAARADPAGWWMQQALSELEWMTPPAQGLDDSNPPFYRWFADGELNASAECLDRHLRAGGGDKVAYVWIGESGDDRDITYQQLHDEVNRLANALRAQGIERGDRVAIYLGMVPELPISMLACARIGAAHSVVFGGFSATSLAGRINDSGCKALITADGSWRKGAIVPLKQWADDALADCPTIETVVVVRRTGQEIAMQAGRDVEYADIVAAADDWCEPERMGAEDVLFLLYTSGTTARPKGIVHSTAGYLLGAKLTHRLVFDLRDDDVYWCTADIGWVTGHSYIVYGPLANHATQIMYEGAHDHPTWSRHWQIVEQHGVTIYYTAPTAIRALIGAGDSHLEGHDLSSLRLLGTVGEPINPEAWIWYHERIGGGRCPIVDTWWQTETGSIMIAPLPGAVATKPGSATLPLPGIGAAVVDEHGDPVSHGGGYLVLTHPWPSMLRTFYADDERYAKTYWERFGPRTYFTGDGARRDEDGYFWLMGRVDDVINVSGHRLSTTEVESSLVSHAAVAEAAVIGATHPVTGETIAAFVTLVGGGAGDDELRGELREHVATQIGKIARPSLLLFSPDLPKTRSGKIMRRLLRDVAEGREIGDTSTLRDPAIVQQIKSEADRQLGRV